MEDNLFLFTFTLLLEKGGLEWRIWSSCHVGVCAAWLGCNSVSTRSWKRARSGKNIPNSVWEVNAFPDGIKALRIMPDVASEVNFLAHLLISCRQVLRQGSTATVITFPSPGILRCTFQSTGLVSSSCFIYGQVWQPNILSHLFLHLFHLQSFYRENFTGKTSVWHHHAWGLFIYPFTT